MRGNTACKLTGSVYMQIIRHAFTESPVSLRSFALSAFVTLSALSSSPLHRCVYFFLSTLFIRNNSVEQIKTVQLYFLRYERIKYSSRKGNLEMREKLRKKVILCAQSQ